MAEVVELVPNDLSNRPDLVLKQAIERKTKDLIVIGRYPDGDLYLASSNPDVGDQLWLIEKAKAKILE